MIALLLVGTTSSLLADQQAITLTITVQSQSGEAIQNAPFEAATLVESRFGMTDQNGQVAFSLQAEETEETVTVRMTNGGFTPLVPQELRAQVYEQFHALRKAYSFRTHFLVPIDGAVLSATVKPEESITIAGRLVSATSVPLAGIVGTRGRVSFDYVLDEEAGAFSVSGVPKGETAELWIGATTSQLHRVILTPAQTTEDADIGDVTIVDRPTDGSAIVQMEVPERLLQPSKMKLSDTASLVAVEEAESHIFDVKKDGRVYWTNDDSMAEYTLPMPAGTYYVTPGGYGDRPFFALFEAVRAGRQAQLDAAGVPKITIVAGQATQFTFDAKAALDAVISVGGDLVPPP